MKTLLIIVVIFVVCLVGYIMMPGDIVCTLAPKLCQETPQPTPQQIIEVPADDTDMLPPAPYDLVISEGAIGGRGSHSIAIVAIIERSIDGKYRYQVELDINQDQFVTLSENDIIELDTQTKLQLVAIEPGQRHNSAPEGGLGKVMFNLVTE